MKRFNQIKKTCNLFNLDFFNYDLQHDDAEYLLIKKTGKWS